jgi:hypothetical protein
MKKRIVLMLWMSLLILEGRSQSGGGVFDQGTSELEDYEAQIAALKEYNSEAEQGYQGGSSGLNNIATIHQAEYSLHQVYFASLAAVNPAIAGMPEVQDIMQLQSVIAEGFAVSVGRWRQSGGLAAEELDFIGQVYSTIMQDGLADLNGLVNLTTPGVLTMTDDQRINGIRALDGDMKRQYLFVQQFSARTDLLIAQRQAAAVEGGALQQVYGQPYIN